MIESREEFADNWVASETEELVEEPETSPSNTRRSFVWLQTLAFLLGLGLLIYVINRVGVQPLFDALLRIGFGFFVILFLSGLRHFLRTISMRAAVPPNIVRSLFAMLSPRDWRRSDQLSDIHWSIAGRSDQSCALRKRVPLTYGVPALVVDNLLYNLSVVFFVLSGACVMLARYPLPPGGFDCAIDNRGYRRIRNTDRAIAAKRRVMMLTWLIDRLGELRLSPKVILKRRHHIYHLESKVYDFYKHHPGAFFLMIACNLLAHVASVAEVYLALKMLGFNPQVAQAYIIESLTKVINFAFAFVPGTIGVYEGGTEVILQKGLGFEPAAVLRSRSCAKPQSFAGRRLVFWCLPGARFPTRGVVFLIGVRVYNVLWIASYFQISLIVLRARLSVFSALVLECCSSCSPLDSRMACCTNVAGVNQTSARRS